MTLHLWGFIMAISKWIILPAVAIGAVALARPAAAQQVGYVNLVTAGFVDPNGVLPALNGVPNAGVNNLAVANPKALLNIGQAYTYTVGSQDLSYTGFCITSYSLTQVQGGKTVTLQGGKIQRYKCAPGNIFFWAVNAAPIPNAPGAAKLTGTVKFGTTSYKFDFPVFIQNAP